MTLESSEQTHESKRRYGPSIRTRNPESLLQTAELIHLAIDRGWLSERQIQVVQPIYDEGMNLNNLAIILGTSYENVRSINLRAVNKARKYYNQGRPPKIQPENQSGLGPRPTKIEKVLGEYTVPTLFDMYYTKEMSLQEVGSIFDCSEQVVRTTLRRMGAKPRSAGRPSERPPIQA